MPYLIIKFFHNGFGETVSFSSLFRQIIHHLLLFPVAVISFVSCILIVSSKLKMIDAVWSVDLPQNEYCRLVDELIDDFEIKNLILNYG